MHQAPLSLGSSKAFFGVPGLLAGHQGDIDHDHDNSPRPHLSPSG